MSEELKAILKEVAVENDVRKRIELEEGINRYKSLLVKVATQKKLDITTSVEGTENPSTEADDLKVLEKAHLVTGETKYTHRNTYREYTLTSKGADLAEKLLKKQD